MLSRVRSTNKILSKIILPNGTFKTIVVDRTTSARLLREKLLRKLCKGRVTEETLKVAKEEYGDHWLFESRSGVTEFLNPTEKVWREGEKEVNLIFAKANDSQLAIINKATEEQASHKLLPTISGSLKQTFIPIFIDSIEGRKALFLVTAETKAGTLQKKMTTKIIRGAVTEEKLKRVNEEYKDYQLYWLNTETKQKKLLDAEEKIYTKANSGKFNIIFCDSDENGNAQRRKSSAPPVRIEAVHQLSITDTNIFEISHASKAEESPPHEIKEVVAKDKIIPPKPKKKQKSISPNKTKPSEQDSAEDSKDGKESSKVAKDESKKPKKRKKPKREDKNIDETKPTKKREPTPLPKSNAIPTTATATTTKQSNSKQPSVAVKRRNIPKRTTSKPDNSNRKLPKPPVPLTEAKKSQPPPPTKPKSFSKPPVAPIPPIEATTTTAINTDSEDQPPVVTPEIQEQSTPPDLDDEDDDNFNFDLKRPPAVAKRPPKVAPPPTPEKKALTKSAEKIEKGFMKIFVQNEGTIKTLMLTPQLTFNETIEAFFKKLCEGRPTEKKLEAVRYIYSTHSLFVDYENGTCYKLGDGDLPWDYRNYKITFREELLNANNKQKQSASTLSDRMSHVRERIKSSAISLKKTKEETVQLSAPIPTLKEDGKYMLTIEVVGVDTKKTILADKQTTVGNIVTDVVRKCCARPQDESALEVTKEKYAGYQLVATINGIAVALADADPIVHLVASDPPPALTLRPPSDLIVGGNILSPEAQLKKIKELEKHVDKLEKQNEKLRQKQKAKKKTNTLKLDLTQVEIQEQLGRIGGSFAFVYAVSVNGWKCAMKEVDTLDVGAEAGVENEILILLDLPPHSHVCKYLFYQKTESKLRLFIELFAGTLREVLTKRLKDKQYFKPKEVHNYFSQIVSGLAHLHANNILHRDLKADNIFYTKHPESGVNRVVVGDFDTSIKLNSQFEVATDVVGTPSFIAPEVLNVREVGGYGLKADVYSCGMILFELLTLEEPFSHCTGLGGISNAILNGEKPIFPPEISGSEDYAPLIGVFNTCTTFDPDERPSMEQLVTILKDIGY